MYKFGPTSLKKLESAHPDLQKVLHEAIKVCDFTILETHRGEREQNQAFREGRSKLTFPNSKHNVFPSLAVDIAPWPINWDDKEQFYYLAGIVMGIAQAIEIPLRWGGDWNRDGRVADNRFNDLPHLELFERRK